MAVEGDGLAVSTEAERTLEKAKRLITDDALVTLKLVILLNKLLHELRRRPRWLFLWRRNRCGVGIPVVGLGVDGTFVEAVHTGFGVKNGHGGKLVLEQERGWVNDYMVVNVGLDL